MIARAPFFGTIALTVGVFSAALAASRPAAACAMLTHSADTLAESDAQQAIFRVEEQGSSVEYRAAWQGDALTLGWIIAVPDSVIRLEDGDDARFAALNDATAPLVVRAGAADEAAGGCGCAGPGSKGALSGDFSDTGRNGVALIDQGFTGTYSYALVSADDADALQAYLNENGFVLEEDARTNIDGYVAEGGWAFALVRVEAEQAGGSLPPVRLWLRDQRLVFPARMGRLDDDRVLQTTWWVEGPSAATLTGWSAADLVSAAIDDQDPAEAFLDALLSVGSLQTGALRTYVGRDGGVWLTRFDAAVGARASTTDARFAFAEREPFHAQLQGQSRTTAGTMAPIGALGVALAWGLRRRRTGAASDGTRRPHGIRTSPEDTRDGRPPAPRRAS